MKLVVLTTQTLHHTYFVRELTYAFSIEAIFVERKTNKACFDTHHPFEDKRKLYEKEVLFNNKEMTLADLGPVVEVDTVSKTEYGSTKRASAMLVAIPKKRKAKFLDVLYSRLQTSIKGRFLRKRI